MMVMIFRPLTGQVFPHGSSWYLQTSIDNINRQQKQTSMKRKETPVPAQYLISKWMTPTISDREYYTRRFFAESWGSLRKLYNITEWMLYVKDLREKLLHKTGDEECAAKEVMEYNEPSGYFSGSPEPRTDRKNVKYRVGQVIKHKRYGYRGVIIGWDLTAKAPDDWIQVNHLHPRWRHQPNYSILVDTRDGSDIQTTYVVEENMEIISKEQVQHPDVEDHFERYDGSQYVPRPWLRGLYPRD